MTFHRIVVSPAFLFFLLLVAPAWARLGETEAQCAARYGEVVKRTIADWHGLKLSLLIFSKSDYRITVGMMKDKAGIIQIQKSDGESDLSDNEIRLFLKAESAGQAWTKGDSISDNQSWKRSDGATALYTSSEHCLSIFSEESIEASKAAKNADETKNTQGF